MPTFSAYEGSRHQGAPVSLFRILGAGDPAVGPYGFTNGEAPITRSGLTYQPWPIKHTPIAQSGTLDKNDITVSMARGTPLDDIWLRYPPSQIVNLTVFEGHTDLAPSSFTVAWMGRIAGATLRGDELDLSSQSISSALARPGLRRHYQIGCPFVLFGPHCKASKAAATVARSVSSSTSTRITLSSALPSPASRFIGGLAEWNNPTSGLREIRTIVNVLSSGTVLQLRGGVRGAPSGTDVDVVRSCNRAMTGCAQHSNILNFGGQPYIPQSNPLSDENQFY